MDCVTHLTGNKQTNKHTHTTYILEEIAIHASRAGGLDPHLYDIMALSPIRVLASNLSTMLGRDNNSRSPLQLKNTDKHPYVYLHIYIYIYIY